MIYDGQCELCRNSIHWVQKKLEITTLDFHATDLALYGLTTEQCSREVFLITGRERLSGAKAAAFLLKARGNTVLSAIITVSGPIGRATYRWVAGNRNSLPVKALSQLLKR